jgi:hypothetical protein
MWAVCNVIVLKLGWSRSSSKTGCKILTVERPGLKTPGGPCVKPGFSCSCYIGDPDVIDHCGLVWGGPRPEQSLGPCDNPTWSHTAILSRFHARCRSLFWLHNLWRACNLTSFSPYLTGPVDYPLASCHKGPGFKTPGASCHKGPGFKTPGGLV